jgi:hypothetical protein
MRTRMLQTLAMNEGYRWKKKLFSERGRARKMAASNAWRKLLSSIGLKVMRGFPLLRCVGLLVLVGLVQRGTSAQCPNRGTVVVDGVSNTQGKPYEAKEIQTIVTYESDGAKQIVVTKANLFRDGKGRIRVERYYDGTSNPSEETPTDIHIDDNCGTSVILRPSLTTAKLQSMAPASLVSSRPCCEEFDLKNPPQPGPEGKFEGLGHKFIDGFEVRGERTSSYATVQAKLSGAPPIRVYENWCSILLDTPMGNYILNDNPKREITTVINNVRQVEPDPELFEIPKDYKISSAQKSSSDRFSVPIRCPLFIARLSRCLTPSA